MMIMKNIADRKRKPVSHSWRYWNVMTFYERFEHSVAMILSGLISIIILIALWDLAREVFNLLMLGSFDLLNHQVFQVVFGMIMTLLIAMEFNHSIIKVLERQAHIIQVKTVILIAQLALARKFIILDFANTEAIKIAALGFAVLALGIVHWMLRERDQVDVHKKIHRQFTEDSLMAEQKPDQIASQQTAK